MEFNTNKLSNGRLGILITLDASDIDFLCHDLKGVEGVKKWFKEGPCKNKIDKCKERMFDEWIPKLRNQGLNIPSSDDELLQLIKSQPDYKDRQSREQ